MTEIRTIQSSEADSFLEILCSVFGLDLERARSVFFTEPFFDLRRKWAVFQGGRIVSMLTTTPLDFGFGRAIGIAGVATVPEARGQGLAKLLLQRVLSEADASGEPRALLFAHDPRLYESVAFDPIDRVVRGAVRTAPVFDVPEPLPMERVRELYDRWAAASPRRLRRDDRRWSYWGWCLRVCEQIDAGYVCVEGSTIREAVDVPPGQTWPVAPSTQWVGMGRMTSALGIPVQDAVPDLYVMGRAMREVPEMFLTDQF